MFNFLDNADPTILNIWIATIGLIVSTVVLFFTISTWKLKIGQSVRASLITSITDKYYISNIIIENLKDRDLVIFGIYLKFGANIYIDLLDIDTHYDRYHHIIPALSTRVFELGPALYYSEHSFEVDIDHLLKNWENGNIILLTNMGKIKAKKFKKSWSPISQYFNNYGTHYIKTHRFYTKESVPSSREQSENFIDYSSYDKNVQYIVTLKFSDGKIYDLDIPSIKTYTPFQKLNFTPDVLTSCESLKQYLLESRENKLIEFDKIIQITNIANIIAKNKKGLFPTPEHYSIKMLNIFQYHIFWKFRTWLHKLLNPHFPSKLFSFYCKLGLKKRPNVQKHSAVYANNKPPTLLNPKKRKKKKKKRR